MARLLGEARVSVLPDGTRFKAEAEAQIKKAQEGLKANVKLNLDKKGFDAQVAAAGAEMIAMQNRVAKARAADEKSAEKDILNRTKMYGSMFDQIAKSESQQAAQEAAMAKANQIAANQQQAAQDRISKARDQDSAKAQKDIENQRSAYAKMFDDIEKGQADITSRSKLAQQDIRVNFDSKDAETQAMSLRDKIKALFSDVKAKISIGDKEAEADAVGLRERLKLIFDDIRANIHVDTHDGETEAKGFLAKLLPTFSKGGNDAGNGFGNSFVGGLAKSAVFQNPGITGLIVAGLGALPAAIGAVGVLGGIALGAGLMIGAESLIKSQLKSLTTEIKSQTTIVNSKTATAAQKQASEALIKQDLAQVDALNKQMAAFDQVNIAVKNLKTTFLTFAGVVTKPLIKPFADALNDLSNQLKGPLAKSFTDLFKAVGPLVKPVEESLILLVNGILPGLTSMLNKARGPLGDMFTTFGKIVGLKVGDWFRAATPYIKDSAKYLNALVSAGGSVITWLIKFGGESAKAFGGSQFKGFGPLIQSIANTLIKVLIPAFEGWTQVMGPVVRSLLQIIAPILAWMAANPTFTRTLLEVVAALQIYYKVLGIARAATLLMIPVLEAFDIEMDANPIGLVVLGIAALAAIAIVVVKNWKPISGFFVGIWHDIHDGFVAPLTNFFEKTIPHAFNVTIDWIKKNWPEIVGLLLAPMTLGVSLIVSVVVTHWNTIKTFTAKIWGDIFSFLKHTWGQIENAASGIFKPIASVVTGVWDQIKSITGTVWNGIFAFFKKWWTTIAEVMTVGLFGVVLQIVKNWGTISHATETAWDAIFNFFKMIWGHIENVFTGATKSIANWVTTAWAAISHATVVAWNNIFAFFKQAWGHIENVFTGFLKPIASVTESTWNSIAHGTVAVWNNIYNYFKQAWGHIENVFTGFLKPIGTQVAAAWNGIKNNTVAVFNAISGFFKSTWAGIENNTMTIVHGLESAIEGVWNKIKSTTASVWHDIGGLMSAGIHAGEDALATSLNAVINVLNGLISGYNAVNNIWSGTDVKPIGKVHFARGGEVTAAMGGHIPGYAPGSDVVPAMLSPGEFVINPVSAKAIGVDNLHAMNKVSGGSAGINVKKSGTDQFVNGGDVAGFANKYVGHPYRFDHPSNPQQGWDCCSFMSYVLGHFGLGIPGGSWNKVTDNGAEHGPASYEYLHWKGAAMKSDQNVDHAQAGDLTVWPTHIGMALGPDRMISAYDTARGTIDTTIRGGGPTGEGLPQLRQLPGVAAGGSVPGSGISPAQQAAFNKYMKLLDFDIKTYSLTHTPAGSQKQLQMLQTLAPTGSPAKGGQYSIMAGNAATLAKPAVQSAYDAAAAAAVAIPGGSPNGGPAGGATGSEMANGLELIQYLSKNLFGGNLVAAAGAAASIWGESTWNPFAEGTGGRGLIGWTPPGTISDADFKGGMKTQLPAILRFVTNSGDSGAITEMFQTNSVLDAANIWGKRVERYGINDVHSEGITLATQLANEIKGGKVAKVRKGGRIPGFAPGSDTVSALLSPGEFVINPLAAKAIGYDNLHQMNKMAGGGMVLSNRGLPRSYAPGPGPALPATANPNMTLEALLAENNRLQTQANNIAIQNGASNSKALGGVGRTMGL